MILIGDKIVPCENIEKINSIDDIKSTKPNSTVIFNYNSDIMSYCMNNNIRYGIIVNSIKEAVYANALGAAYIITSTELSKNIQKTAENYMFDSKVLAVIDSNDEIEKIAEDEIDGIIYRSLI